MRILFLNLKSTHFLSLLSLSDRLKRYNKSEFKRTLRGAPSAIVADIYSSGTLPHNTGNFNLILGVGWGCPQAEGPSSDGILHRPTPYISF